VTISCSLRRSRSGKRLRAGARFGGRIRECATRNALLLTQDSPTLASGTRRADVGKRARPVSCRCRAGSRIRGGARKPSDHVAGAQVRACPVDDELRGHVAACALYCCAVSYGEGDSRDEHPPARPDRSGEADRSSRWFLPETVRTMKPGEVDLLERERDVAEHWRPPEAHADAVKRQQWPGGCLTGAPVRPGTATLRAGLHLVRSQVW